MLVGRTMNTVKHFFKVSYTTALFSVVVPVIGIGVLAVIFAVT